MGRRRTVHQIRVSEHRTYLDTHRLTPDANAAMSKKSSRDAKTDIPIENYEHLLGAIHVWVGEHNITESTAAYVEAVEKINSCTNLTDVFIVPIKGRMLTPETALEWMFFLHKAPEYAVGLGDAQISKSACLRLDVALDEIASTFDVRTVAVMSEAFQEDNDSDSDDSGSDSGSANTDSSVEELDDDDVPIKKARGRAAEAHS